MSWRNNTPEDLQTRVEAEHKADYCERSKGYMTETARYQHGKHDSAKCQKQQRGKT